MIELISIIKFSSMEISADPQNAVICSSSQKLLDVENRFKKNTVFFSKVFKNFIFSIEAILLDPFHSIRSPCRSPALR